MALRRRTTIEQINIIINSKGGNCLTPNIKDGHSRVLIICKNGHIWKPKAKKILEGQWCKICKLADGRSFNIEYLKNYAKNKNGECLSNNYTNNNFSYKWKCNIHNYEWNTSWGNVYYENNWCSICGKKSAGSLDENKKYALKHNGDCVSEVYTFKKAYYLWKCKNNHTWKSTASAVLNGHWCPHCRHQISNQQKEIFNEISLKYSLNIILNDTQTIKPMDLDIYIPSLKIAIEYDGEYWHYSDRAIKNGSLDRMKKKDAMCVKKDIKLLRIRENDWNYNKGTELQKITDFINNFI